MSSAPKKKKLKFKETPVVNPYLGRIAEFYATVAAAAAAASARRRA
jgi:hypothetical protein